MSRLHQLERLKRLSPIEAIQTWLEGDFGLDEEPALCAAIRKDLRTILSSDEIFASMSEAMEGKCDAQRCLERLVCTGSPEDT